MDFPTHLMRQLKFSLNTFGPGARMNGVLDHMEKEMQEVREAKDHHERQKEWVDLVILACDGLMRELVDSGLKEWQAVVIAARLIDEKMTRNEKREWPDWRTADPDKAIEHVRK